MRVERVTQSTKKSMSQHCVILLSLIVSLSAGFLCAQQCFRSDFIAFVVAIGVSCIVTFFVAFRTIPIFVIDYRFALPRCILAVLFACSFAYGSNRYVNVSPDFFPYDLNGFLATVLALPCCIFIAYLLIVFIEKYLRYLYFQMNSIDKKVLVVFSVVAILGITLLYTTNDLWYMQYDDVYSMDSKFCFQTVFQNAAYFDIRHPLLGCIARPLWCTTYGLVHFLAPSNLEIVICAIVLQSLNVFFIIAIGAMIRVMSGNGFVLLIFVCSSSTLLFSVFFEKYALCAFFLVLSLYLTLFKPKYASLSYVAAIGAMPTSIYAIVVFAIILGIKASWKNAVRVVFFTVCIGVFAILCSGHLWLFDFPSTLSNISLYTTTFASEPIDFYGRVLSCLNLLQGIFLPLPSVSEEAYNWIPLHTAFSKIAIIILIVVLLGLIRGVANKDRFTVACGFWFLFVFVLFIGVNWVPAESALFSLYFSWAIVPLFAKGVSWVCSLLLLSERWVWISLSAVCLVLSLASISSIAGFLYSL